MGCSKCGYTYQHMNIPFTQPDACKHKSTWFSRIIEEDNTMHTYCIDCGKRDTEFYKELAMDGQTLKTGEKKDEGKPRWELLAYDAIEGIVATLTSGAQKYAARNWELGILYGRVYGAAMRHLSAWWKGETTDPESGRSHLDHALTELMFLSAYEKRGMKQFDDRPNSIKQDIRQG